MRRVTGVAEGDGGCGVARCGIAPVEVFVIVIGVGGPSVRAEDGIVAFWRDGGIGSFVGVC